MENDFRQPINNGFCKKSIIIVANEQRIFLINAQAYFSALCRVKTNGSEILNTRL